MTVKFTGNNVKLSETMHTKNKTKTHLWIHSLHLVFLQLKLHKIVNDVEKLRRDSLEVLVVVILDRQRGKDSVIDKCRAEISQHARRVLPWIFVKVLSYEVVKNCIAEELQSLVTIWRWKQDKPQFQQFACSLCHHRGRHKESFKAGKDFWCFQLCTS